MTSDPKDAERLREPMPKWADKLIRERDATIADLQAEIERLRDLFRLDGVLHANHVRELTKVHETRITKYAEAIREHKATIADLTQQRDQLESERGTKIGEIADLEAEILRSSKLAALDFDRHCREKSVLRDTVADLEQQVESLTIKTPREQAMRETIHGQGLSMRAMGDELREAHAKIADLEQQLAARDLLRYDGNKSDSELLAALDQLIPHTWQQMPDFDNVLREIGIFVRDQEADLERRLAEARAGMTKLREAVDFAHGWIGGLPREPSFEDKRAAQAALEMAREAVTFDTNIEDYLDSFEAALAPPPPAAEASGETRCKRTGNLCGTDTWSAGHPCPCENCQTWLRTTQIPRAPQPTADHTVTTERLNIICTRGAVFQLIGEWNKTVPEHLPQLWNKITKAVDEYVAAECAAALTAAERAGAEKMRERAARVADEDARLGHDDLDDPGLERLAGARILAAERIACAIRDLDSKDPK